MSKSVPLCTAVTVAFVITLGAAGPDAQSPIDRLRDLMRLPGLGGVLTGNSPVTTSLDDARTGIDFLDRFEPAAPFPLSGQAQDDSGVFHVNPGAYRFTAQSYCLHAGTHGPGGGGGYLLAPLDGARGDVVRAILQSSAAHQDIRQRDIQVLLWAILARTPVHEMPRRAQVVATRLLTPAQLVELGVGFGSVPDGAWQQAVNALPLEARQVFEADGRLRQLFARSDAPFSELERVAVLIGNPLPDPRSHRVPRGRWSYHQNGYYIRFFPSGYDKTDIHLYVPEPVEVRRDEAGRITVLADGRGTMVEVGYGEPAAPGRTMQSYAPIRAIRIEGAHLDEAGSESSTRSWTWERDPASANDSSTDGPWSGRSARLRTTSWQETLTQSGDGRRQGLAPDVRTLEDLAYFQQELEETLESTGDPSQKALAASARDLAARAWAAEFCRLAGACADYADRTVVSSEHLRPDDANRSFRFGSRAIVPRAPFVGSAGGWNASAVRSPRFVHVDLSESVAVPGQRGRQRLAMSGRAH